MKEEWLMSGAVVPVDVETTAALVAEIKRLIDVVGGMALAQVEQEPVAWMTINEYGEEDDIHYENPEGHLLEGWTHKPLYTHAPTVQPKKEPPKREWQGLTDEELQFYRKKYSKLFNAGYDKVTDTNLIAEEFDSAGFYKEVEAVLRERNI